MRGDRAATASPEVSVGDAGSPGAQYYVRLENFEGPLDLLLHLIQEHELDILDIPIAFVAERYVSYITLMEELNIDIASEYLLMAATLTHIKSRLLLPAPPEDQDDPDADAEIDPRAELVRRLLEYQKYKDAAEQLGSRSVVGRDVFGRGSAAPQPEGPAPLAQIGLFKLLDAFQSVLDRVEKTLDHQVEFDRLSITERINELVDMFRERPRWEFTELFAGQQSRAEVITTFLALLEMTRLRMTRLTQEGPFEPILVEATLGEVVLEEALRDLGIAGSGVGETERENEGGGVSLTDAELAAAALDDLVCSSPDEEPCGESAPTEISAGPSPNALAAEPDPMAAGSDATAVAEISVGPGLDALAAEPDPMAAGSDATEPEVGTRAAAARPDALIGEPVLEPPGAGPAQLADGSGGLLEVERNEAPSTDGRVASGDGLPDTERD
ncbi:MAG: segregation/condensation protein A [Polyangiaceae bacterium]|nr:segregation/condensation protein A [Polyangiaceae bacterium]